MSSHGSLPEAVPDHVASIEQFRAALLAIRPSLTDNMLTMLRYQYRAPNHAATATELAQAAGYKTYEPANRQYGELGKLIADALTFTPPRRADGTHKYWSTLSTGDPSLEEGEHWRFVMRPELAAAIRELRWG
jgi:hypothetical protein